jgi:hypothetical protein
MGGYPHLPVRQSDDGIILRTTDCRTITPVRHRLPIVRRPRRRQHLMLAVVCLPAPARPVIARRGYRAGKGRQGSRSRRPVTRGERLGAMIDDPWRRTARGFYPGRSVYTSGMFALGPGYHRRRRHGIFDARISVRGYRLLSTSSSCRALPDDRLSR